jgi:ubiquinone/menaquinone biosynthesis C-methylase UbiE
MTAIDYDEIASDYDRRYELHDYPGIRAALFASIQSPERPRVLEVGCGTGRWLEVLQSAGCQVAGVDASTEMLRRAATQVGGDLRVGSAEALPWEDASFALVLYVNAFHHFARPQEALREAYRVLRQGGTLLSIGLDPHESLGQWYVYEFFPTTIALDLHRFPSRDCRSRWLHEAGFSDVRVVIAEHVKSSLSLDEALRDGVLAPSFTSHLTALTPDAYADGIERIRRAARDTEGFRLEVDLLLYATRGRKPVEGG